MKGLILLALVLAVIAGGLKLNGGPLPLIDYPIGSFGIDSPGPVMPDIEVKPPGFDEFDAP